ncbi:MAG: type II toxin-antitoxin system RelE/ParE family toxin [Bdellovibrionales bacterium]|jgi:phage-related protein|nr:type II toxin-antitoxin system RelE/ParE family toxin [Bdellovibrionales bacterium]
MKPAKFHPAVRLILKDFPEDIRREIGKAIFELQNGIKLTMPLSRPMADIGSNVHEIRVKDRSGAYRVFYITISTDGVYVFHAFKKTTQATPKKEIQLGQKRLQEIL